MTEFISVKGLEEGFNDIFKSNLAKTAQVPTNNQNSQSVSDYHASEKINIEFYKTVDDIESNKISNSVNLLFSSFDNDSWFPEFDVAELNNHMNKSEKNRENIKEINCCKKIHCQCIFV